MQIDNRQIVIGVGPRGGGEGVPGVGLVELGIRVESAQHSFDALADQFMVIGHKKLHDVSACRHCALVFPTLIPPMPDADGTSPRYAIRPVRPPARAWPRLSRASSNARLCCCVALLMLHH